MMESQTFGKSVKSKGLCLVWRQLFASLFVMETKMSWNNAVVKWESVPKLRFTEPVISLPVHCIGGHSNFMLWKNSQRKTSWNSRQCTSFITSHFLVFSWCPVLNAVRTCPLTFFYPINCNVEFILCFVIWFFTFFLRKKVFRTYPAKI